MADKLTRRQFIQDSAIAVTAAGAALSMADRTGAAESKRIDTGKILNYNGDM